MKRILFLLSLLSMTVAAGAQAVLPPRGFPFSETTVRISGEDLVPSAVDCTSLCSGATCAVEVLFGSEPGDVEIANPHTIIVIAPPQPDGTIKAPGREPRVIPAAFRYDTNTVTTAADYVSYLVPLTEGVAGANGSLWEVEQVVYNATDATFAVPGTTCAPNVSPCPQPATLTPLTTSRLYFNVLHGNGTDGVFMYLPEGVHRGVTMQVRVRNTSQGDRNWGTELPVVPATDFRERVNVLDVPTDARFRATLRIYGGSAPMPAHVRVMLPNVAQPVEERDVDLAGIIEIVPNPFPDRASYAQLDLLTDAVRAAGPRVYVEVTTPVEHAKLWAFISLTNNTTQQVTAITPHLTEE